MNKLWKYLKEYRKESVLAPVFKLLESLMDLGELADKTATRLIFRGQLGKLFESPEAQAEKGQDQHG